MIDATVRTARLRTIVGVVLFALGALLLTSASADAQERTLLVPQDYPTVQAAVDDSSEGDLILIDEGVYNEAVYIGPEHAGITLRGVDRNKVIFDGNFELGTAIEAIGADNVVMENMTARNYAGNGFYWQSVDGFRGSYLTAYRIGVYAIFSFDAANGVFEHSYASGSADASYYVGQCFPCNIRLTDLIAEYSALGYSGTNAGGDLILENSLWQLNGTGILPNSLTAEANPPQRQATIINNVVKDNNNANTPAKGLSGAIVGLGIGLAGGNENVVEGNVVENHTQYGIAIFPLPEPDPIWIPVDNVVRGNEVSGSGFADLAVTAGSGEGNCFEGNTFGTSDPPQIESTHPCEGSGLNAGPIGSPASAAVLGIDYGTSEAGLDQRASYQDMPDAPLLENMPADHVPAQPPADGTGECCVSGHGGGEAVNAAEGATTDTSTQTGLPAAAPTSTPLPVTGGGVAAMLIGAGLTWSGIRLRRS